MAAGTDAWSGAVPLYGESTITQTTLATDILTIQGVASQTGDFLVLRNSAESELWYVVAAGRQIMAVTHSGTAALSSLDITTTDATTFSSGYGAAIYLRTTQSGAKTGNANTSQFNALACDLTISAAAPYINGFYFYITQSGSPTLTSDLVYGGTIYIEELGATSSLVGLSIEKANTTKGTNYDTFIKMSCQGSGVAKSAIAFTGTHNPDYFIQFQSTADFIIADTSNLPAAATYKLKCKAGSTEFYLIGVADF